MKDYFINFEREIGIKDALNTAVQAFESGQVGPAFELMRRVNDAMQSNDRGSFDDFNWVKIKTVGIGVRPFKKSKKEVVQLPPDDKVPA